MGEINKSINAEIELNANKTIAANAMFAGELKSTLIDNQIATENALYSHTRQIDGTLMTGFSGVSRQLGAMGSAMNMGFAFLNSAVQESSKAICDKLDDINETLKNPLYTESRELYNRALKNYNKELYEEALEDLQEAVKKNKADPLTYFLMGQIYMRGIGEFSNMIDLNAAIEALKNAAKYITHDAKTYPEVRPMAAEICFYWGLACHAKANDNLHNSNEADYNKLLEEAKTAYSKSWDYSQDMLESLYNLARCKALTNDEDGAIQDLMTVTLKDHGYCLKAGVESDFDDAFKGKLWGQLKKEVFPKANEVFNRIESIRADFKAPYSSKLNTLIKTCLPDTFTENTPPFDMLEGSVNFPKILPIIEVASFCRQFREPF
jgi:tetratricopeptide (TPR) repeat protein